jgi:hypothetical protein
MRKGKNQMKAMSFEVEDKPDNLNLLISLRRSKQGKWDPLFTALLKLHAKSSSEILRTSKQDLPGYETEQFKKIRADIMAASYARRKSGSHPCRIDVIPDGEDIIICNR